MFICHCWVFGKGELRLDSKLFLQDNAKYRCSFPKHKQKLMDFVVTLLFSAISDPKVETKLIPSPDKAQDSKKMVEMSCSATGKPAPKITWHLPSILQQKPREYHIKFSNETVTVISNFTHTHSKILQEYPITCVIQHPSLNVTLVPPTDSLEQGQYVTLLLLWSGAENGKHLLGQIRQLLRGLGAGGEGTWKSSCGWAWEGWRRCCGTSRCPGQWH